MLGYDISWAAFNIIEVMSSTKFTYKRVGYLSASQSYHENTDVMMLTTNMIRKVQKIRLEQLRLDEKVLTTCRASSIILGPQLAEHV